MDFPTVATAAGLVNNAISVLKSARDIAKDESNSELNEKINDAYGALLDLRELALAQDDEIRGLKQQLAERAKFCGPIAPHGYYYFDDDAEDEVNPLCPICFQAKPQQIAYLGETKGYTRGNGRMCKLNTSHLIYES